MRCADNAGMTFFDVSASSVFSKDPGAPILMLREHTQQTKPIKSGIAV